MNRVSMCMVALGLAAMVVLAGCSGGSGSSTSSSPATVAVTLSDPATCGSGALGNLTFQSVFVTVTDVQINASATAGDNDPNWIDLTPNLKNSPQTIDLMSKASAQCFLATLAASANLAPGTYQQVRVFLASSGSNQSCGSAGPNCVVPTGGTPQPLLLNSQAQTGLKIPSGQIAGGNFTVAAGDNKTLNIDLDACASIVIMGPPQSPSFRLKPVLHAGEVNTTSSSIDGTLVDKTSGQAISGAKAIVVLEQKDSAGIDRKVMETVPDSSGHFVFCPVSSGSYDVVAVVVSGSGVSYPAAVITGVAPGNGLGNIALTAVTGTNTAQGTIAGSVSTQSGASPPAAISEDVTLSVLAQAGSGTYTIPLPLETPVAATTATVNTQSGTTCAANTDCATYSVSVPGATPTVAAFTSGSAVSFASGGAIPASYTVEGAANCSAAVTTTALSVSPGSPSVPNPAPAIALTGCQ